MKIPVLLLFADTGGGHRSAAQAVADALDEEYPGVFAPRLYDPLSAGRAPRLLRAVTGLYAPLTRRAPWAWGIVYRVSDSRPAAALLRRTWLRLADRPVTEVVAAGRPAVVLSFHPLATAAAVRAGGSPVVTVVTDLVATHATWRFPAVDRIVVPSAAVRRRCEADGIAAPGCLDAGIPVGADFRASPLSDHQRRALRRHLGVDPRRFLVVLAGGGEGAGPIASSAAALVESFGDVDVVAICGRNRRLEARLGPLAARRPGRLTVRGFVDRMADWYRAADLVVTKAGPQTIAEATCCGAALILTSHLPGQERGNTDLVAAAGAGRPASGPRDLVDAVARLKDDPDALRAMRRASLAMARPAAARQVAGLVAGLAPRRPAQPEEHGAA